MTVSKINWKKKVYTFVEISTFLLKAARWSAAERDNGVGILRYQGIYQKFFRENGVNLVDKKCPI